ncbi:WxL protein peptidoglycan domain-containing protein [Candidatus Enterococcus mansonii]|uniref:Uncharacterized protein n=1 Tax=Candidatus Enterococcus mansonii TaxID=1834181 RepID=A0A242CDK4_9ENTE|nr:DUF916 domain-containing protein [Enterococcus sp. 4G2_DIV0659]OTO08000.1 hypothetical protein A5880_002270 [Enterococcus sp. 4G2_DIV0659]
MKKRIIGISLFLMLSIMAGCSTKKETTATKETTSEEKNTAKYDSAMEKGKEAIVDKDLTQAIASFQLALEYEKDDEEATSLIEQVELYKEAVALKEKKEYSKALKKAVKLVDSKKGSTSLKQYGKELIEELEAQKDTKQAVEATDGKMKFNVTKKKNNTSDNPDIGYFELTTKKGTKQKIQLDVENLEEEELTIEQAIYSAWTSEKGTIEYKDNPEGYDSSLTHKMSEYITFEEGNNFTLAPKETKTITAIITIPKDITDGDALGGWHLEEKINSDKKPQHRYASITGVHLFVGQTPKDNKLSIAEIETDDDLSEMMVKIENPIAKTEVFKHLTIELLSKEGESIIKKTEEGFKMAPNSSFEYELALDQQKEISSGKYVVKMTIELEDGQVATQEKEVKITQ